jgi:hypothetical protein
MAPPTINRAAHTTHSAPATLMIAKVREPSPHEDHDREVAARQPPRGECHAPPRPADPEGGEREAVLFGPATEIVADREGQEHLRRPYDEQH